MNTENSQQFVLGNGAVLLSAVRLYSEHDHKAVCGIEIEELSDNIPIGKLPFDTDLRGIQTGNKVQLVILNIEGARALQRTLEVVISTLEDEGIRNPQPHISMDTSWVENGGWNHG